eukprot:scaffold79700_cov45-Cyclotella_meneghiniana.AAC.4
MADCCIVLKPSHLFSRWFQLNSFVTLVTRPFTPGEEEDWEINDDNLDTIGSHPQAPGIEVVKKTEEQIALELEARMEEGYKSRHVPNIRHVLVDKDILIHSGRRRDEDRYNLEVPLNRNENGQCTHDDITVFITDIERHFKGLYNPLQPGQGLTKLLKKGPNDLTKLKSTHMVTASSILTASIKEAKELAKQSGVDEKPTIATRADAQDEADRRNYAIQATIGAKEGAAEAITNKVGSDITDSVLRNVDGNDNKGVDEYNLYEVIQATIQGAIRPTMTEILTQKIAVINYTFDFRKKVATNMEVLRAKANRVISYGISHDDTEIALTLLANVDKATHHDWGLEFRPAMQEVRKNYNYNYTHDAASLANMLKEFEAADAIRTLSDSPEPTNEAAHLV